MNKVLFTLMLLWCCGTAYAEPTYQEGILLNRAESCVALDSRAKDHDWTTALTFPEEVFSKDSPDMRLNLSVKVAHEYAARTLEVIMGHEATESSATTLNDHDLLQLSQVLGCTYPHVGEFVLYKTMTVNRTLILPVAKGTPLPIPVSVCLEGPGPCLFGEITERQQLFVELYLKEF